MRHQATLLTGFFASFFIGVSPFLAFSFLFARFICYLLFRSILERARVLVDPACPAPPTHVVEKVRE